MAFAMKPLTRRRRALSRSHDTYEQAARQSATRRDATNPEGGRSLSDDVPSGAGLRTSGHVPSVSGLSCQLEKSTEVCFSPVVAARSAFSKFSLPRRPITELYATLQRHATSRMTFPYTNKDDYHDY